MAICTASDAGEVNEHFGESTDDVTVECHVVEGTRIDRIVEFSIEHKADLILLGHRNARTRTAIARPAAGDDHACSVWSVPEGSPARIDRILAPIDFSDTRPTAWRSQPALARLLGIDSCEAIHVFFDPSAIRYDERVDEIRGDEQGAFDQFLADVNTHGVHRAADLRRKQPTGRRSYSPRDQNAPPT